MLSRLIINASMLIIILYTISYYIFGNNRKEDYLVNNHIRLRKLNVVANTKVNVGKNIGSNIGDTQVYVGGKYIGDVVLIC